MEGYSSLSEGSSPLRDQLTDSNLYTLVKNPSQASLILESLDPSCSSDKFSARPPFFKWVTFSDIIPYIKNINKLYPEFPASDLPKPDKNLNIETRIIELDHHWTNEKKKTKPKFSRALCKTFAKEIAQSFVLVFIDNTSRIFHAIYIGKIVRVITSKGLREGLQSEELINSAALLSVFVIIVLFAKNWAFYIIGTTLYQAKLTISGLLYTKLNSISLSSLHELNIGKVINLIGNDLNDLQNMVMVPSVMLNPYLLGLGTYVMWGYFGPSCIVGLLFLILILICQIYLSNLTTESRKTNKARADDRVKLTHEMVESIRLIKMYTWERLFQNRILALREAEHKTFMKMTYIDAVGRNFSTVSSYLSMLLICISACVFFNETLSPEKVYASMVILTYLGSALFCSYQGRMGLVNFRMISTRIEELLGVPDVMEPDNTSPMIRR